MLVLLRYSCGGRDTPPAISKVPRCLVPVAASQSPSRKCVVRFPADAVFDVSCEIVFHLFIANAVATAQRQDVRLAWQCVHVAVRRR